MSTIPIMVISQGKPILSAIDPPIDGPTLFEDRSQSKLVKLFESLQADTEKKRKSITLDT